jgi:hypothetical protein
VDALDRRVSQRLQVILERVQRVVRAEVGEDLGISLLVMPFSRPGEPDRVAEFQYISNMPRRYMHGALKALLAKWDAGMADIPPHEKQ